MEKIFAIVLMSLVNTAKAQCYNTERYSDNGMNLDKIEKVGQSTYIHHNSPKDSSAYLLTEIIDGTEFRFVEQSAFKTEFNVFFDSSGRVNLYKMKIGVKGVDGANTNTIQGRHYYDNGNLKVSLSIFGKNKKSGKVGSIAYFRDTSAVVCDLMKLKRDSIFTCFMLLGKWYNGNIQNKELLSKDGFLKRYAFYRRNKKLLQEITIDWKSGFVL